MRLAACILALTIAPAAGQHVAHGDDAGLLAVLVLGAVGGALMGGRWGGIWGGGSRRERGALSRMPAKHSAPARWVDGYAWQR